MQVLLPNSAPSLAIPRSYPREVYSGANLKSVGSVARARVLVLVRVRVAARQTQQVAVTRVVAVGDARDYGGRDDRCRAGHLTLKSLMALCSNDGSRACSLRLHMPQAV